MKLNQQIRQNLVHAMTVEAFSKRREKLEKRSQQLDNRVYAKITPKQYRDQMESLPDCFWKRISYIYTIGADDQYRHHQLSEEQKIPAGWKSNQRHRLEDRKLCEDLQRVSDDLEKLSEEERQFAHEAAAVLSEIRSLNQLEERWPEAVTFLPKSEQRALVADVSNLNKILKQEA